MNKQIYTTTVSGKKLGTAPARPLLTAVTMTLVSLICMHTHTQRYNKLVHTHTHTEIQQACAHTHTHTQRYKLVHTHTHTQRYNKLVHSVSQL